LRSTSCHRRKEGDLERAANRRVVAGMPAVDRSAHDCGLLERISILNPETVTAGSVYFSTSLTTEWSPSPWPSLDAGTSMFKTFTSP